MKRHILLLVILLLGQAAHAQDITVPETNRPLVVKKTADWCPKCGDWGWALFEGILEDNAEKALCLAAHYSGGYQNPAAQGITSNFGGFSQPIIYLNGQNMGANSTNIESVRNAAADQIAAINDQAPVVQAGLIAGVDDANTAIVHIKTRFFEPTEGEYYLGAYLIERTFRGPQAGQGNDALHKQMLRLSFSGSPFGELIASGSIGAGTEIENTFSVSASAIESSGAGSLEGLSTGNFEVGTVIWKKEGSFFQPVNTNSADIGILTDIGDISGLNALKAWPIPAERQVQLRVELEAPMPAVQIGLYGHNGALLRRLFSGTLPEGNSDFLIGRQNLPAGQYFIRLSAGGGVAGRPVIFK